jgi:starch synthase
VSRSESIRVLLAASEVVGFAKTGGLADVAGSLPPALARRGIDCAVILPLYRSARAAKVPLERTDLTFHVPIGGRPVSGRLWRSRLAGSDVPVYLVEHADYYERDDPTLGHGLYQFTQTGGAQRDYPDNCARFVFFCRAVLEAMRLLDFWPNVLHLNDWHTGLAPVYLREVYAKLPDVELQAKYGRVRTLFTIHNIAHQGVFWQWDMVLAGLDWRLFNPAQLEFYGHLNFLKAGIVFSDWVSTVSPTYAREVQTPYFGCGLQGVLAERRERFVGIVNGADYKVWDPANDAHLAATYSADAVRPGKSQCKAALQGRLGLAVEAETPLLGVVARLAEQKGIDLLVRAAAGFLQRETQLVVLGKGDGEYHRALEAVRSNFPGRVALVFAFDEGLAHQIEAGADLFLMPSLYEPSGLNQLYSMRYGTPPVVRATGGLADTVIDATPETLEAGTATGFSFKAYSPDGLLGAVQRALALYRGPRAAWDRLVRTAMRQDWSWDRSAAEYEHLYERAMEGQR